jgi:hypothetical protein
MTIIRGFVHLSKGTMAVSQVDKGFFGNPFLVPSGLHTRGQLPMKDALQNAYMAIIFVSFGTKSLSKMNLIFSSRIHIFLSKLMQTPQFHLLMDFYLRGMCPRSLQPNIYNVKRS